MCFFWKSDLLFVLVFFWVLVGLFSLFLEFSPQCSHPTTNMANMEQQMRQMFIHLGFSQAVMTSIIDDHSIVTLTDLLHFEPSDIDTLCKNIQHPGCTIASCNNQQVPNPGKLVSTMAQSNLKLATFWIMHRLERVQCPTTPLDVTHDAINTFMWQQKTEES